MASRQLDMQDLSQVLTLMSSLWMLMCIQYGECRYGHCRKAAGHYGYHTSGVACAE